MQTHRAPLAICALVVAACSPALVEEGGGAVDVAPIGGDQPGSPGRVGPSTGTSGGDATTSVGTGAGGSGGGGTGAGGQSQSTGGGPASLGPGFNLIGAYPNGSSVPVDLIDPTTGQGAPLGDLGPLGGWVPNLVRSAAGTRVFVMGNPSGSFENLLVSLDLTTGVRTAVTTGQQYILAGAVDEHRVIGVFWNGSAEEVDLVDSATGAATSVGQLGDLHWWTSEATYDRATRTVYAWGEDQSHQGFLYRLDIDTHASSAVPLSFPVEKYVYPLGGVGPAGDLVGTTWNGSAEIVTTIDPLTATATPRGSFAGLHNLTQSGSIAYDATRDEAYGIGTPFQSDAWTCYTLDLTTGESTQVLVPHQYILAQP